MGHLAVLLFLTACGFVYELNLLMFQVWPSWHSNSAGISGSAVCNLLVPSFCFVCSCGIIFYFFSLPISSLNPLKRSGQFLFAFINCKCYWFLVKECNIEHYRIASLVRMDFSWHLFRACSWSLFWPLLSGGAEFSSCVFSVCVTCWKISFKKLNTFFNGTMEAVSYITSQTSENYVSCELSGGQMI